MKIRIILIFKFFLFCVEEIKLINDIIVQGIILDFKLAITNWIKIYYWI
jgi:hypothetical protein